MTINIKPASKEVQSFFFQDLEKKIGNQLPRDYRDFLKRYNRSTISGNMVEKDDVKFSISYFFGFSDEKNIDITNQIAIYANRIPSTMMPIAMAGGGNLVCIELPNGTAYYWDHESEGDSNEENIGMHFLANSFTNFFDMIQPYDPKEDLEDMQIESVKLRPGFAEKFKDYLK